MINHGLRLWCTILSQMVDVQYFDGRIILFFGFIVRAKNITNKNYQEQYK